MELKQIIRLGKQLGLSVSMFFAIPIANVKAEARPALAPEGVLKDTPSDNASFLAQITTDESLPTTVEQLQEIMNINGGERAGNNLFHSFEEFSIPEGMQAVFENASDIENIFTRITGESISNIDGILKTQGDANFFLVNPNGIIFGKNAQLDVGGSFIATTADSIQFEGGTEFAANDSAQKPIITIDRPIGLGFGGNSGAITVNGTGNQIINDSSFSPIEFSQTPTGISVPNDKTLALVGNEINLNGGVITTKGGQVYLVSIESGSVGINQTESRLDLVNNNTIRYQNINLNQQSLIDASNEFGGTISLTGENVNLKDASFLLAQNQGNLLGGSLEVKALESLTLSGNSIDGEIASTIRAENLSTGSGGNIDISANQLKLRDSGRIQTATFGESKNGKINIQTSDAIELNSGIISSITLGEANAGNMQLSTSKLKITDKGVLTAATLGTGDGGEIIINADSIDVVENPQNESQVERTNISASSFNVGNAGNLTINTQRLQIIDGASLSSSSFNVGNAGNVIINASELIKVSGINQNFKSSSNPESTIRTAVQLPTSQRQSASESPIVQTGNSGNLTLNTPSLNVSEQATITVENEGTGKAGTLFIDADKISLDTFGSISATSASGTGGNIQIDTEQLQLDQDSSITATAENNGGGGNITINTTSLLAKKNSEITANAFAGTGGNIQIDTQGLFLFPDSTIQASSELGIDGRVKINTLDTNLQRDLELSELNLVTSEESLANSCLARRNEQQGSFVISNGSNLSTVSESDFYDSGSITGIDERKRSGLPTMFHSRRDNSFSNSQVEQLPIIESQSSDSPIPAQQAVKTESGRIFLVSAPESVKSLICN